MLKWIIILFVILLILRFLSRTKLFYSSRQPFEEKPEGEITIENLKKTKRPAEKQDNDKGDYVPFEEIK